VNWQLLVGNKIISLDLNVADVYRKKWQAEHAGEAMLIVYRMRGLLGDATEEFVATLDTTSKGENVMVDYCMWDITENNADETDAYPLARVIVECGGLESILSRLDSVTCSGSGRHLLAVLTKLLGYCIKSSSMNRDRLIIRGAIGTMLGVFERLIRKNDASLHSNAEVLLQHMNTLLMHWLGDSTLSTVSGLCYVRDTVWIVNYNNGISIFEGVSD
jgi:E3 ubiquitin-protein ligase UBR4